MTWSATVLVVPAGVTQPAADAVAAHTSTIADAIATTSPFMTPPSQLVPEP